MKRDTFILRVMRDLAIVCLLFVVPNYFLYEMTSSRLLMLNVLTAFFVIAITSLHYFFGKFSKENLKSAYKRAAAEIDAVVLEQMLHKGEYDKLMSIHTLSIMTHKISFAADRLETDSLCYQLKNHK